MPLELNTDAPFPDPDEIAARAETQQRLYKEAAENPQQTIPAAFIADCARCETLADRRRREGFYTQYYPIRLDQATAEQPDDTCWPGSFPRRHLDRAFSDHSLPRLSGDDVSVPELWQRIRTGGSPNKLSQVPLVHYISREESYVYTQPIWVGFGYGLPMFIYTYCRENSDDSSCFAIKRAYLWLCGWILHARGFFDPSDFTPSLYFLKQSYTPSPAPDSVSRAEAFVRTELPGIDAQKTTTLPDGLNLYRFPYHKDTYADRVARWRRLYFNERTPARCGGCPACRR